MTRIIFLRNVAIIFACLAVMTACGGGNKQNGAAQQSGETKMEVKSEAKGGRLYDIKDSEITVEDGGDLSIVPNSLKKGLGKFGRFTVSNDGAVKLCQILFHEVTFDQLKELRQYYLANCGTVIDSKDKNLWEFKTFDLVFDWGEINGAHSGREKGSIIITVMFTKK